MISQQKLFTSATGFRGRRSGLTILHHGWSSTEVAKVLLPVIDLSEEATTIPTYTYTEYIMVFTDTQPANKETQI